MRKINIIFVIVLLLLFVEAISAGSLLNIKISKIKPRDQYKLKLINLFLTKSGTKFKIIPLNFYITKSREFEEMKKGSLVNVALFTSSISHESSLIPIRFPIYKGLIGYRIFIINKEKQKIFNKIKSVNALKKLVCAQGLNWTDTNILIANGFNVYRIRYQNILKMINLDHGIDFFPRGIHEIFFEMDINKKHYPNLSIEKHFMLHYPLAMYLFVSPKAPKIASAIEKGFKIALSDGSLKKLQNGYIMGTYSINKILNLVKTEKRKIFELSNPFLTEKSKNALDKFSLKLSILQ